MRGVRIVVAISLVLGISYGAASLNVSAGPSRAFADVEGARTSSVEGKLRQALVASRKENAKLRRQVFLRTDRNGFDVYEAAELAARVSGWPVAGATRVAFCESRHVEHARNSKALSGANASGWWQVLFAADGRASSTWHSTRVGKVFPGDWAIGPINALVAAEVWDRSDGVIGNRRGSFAEWKDICAGLG